MNQPKEQVEVPEAAVEAAAKRFHADSHADGFPYAWDDGEKGVLVCDETKDAYRDAVRPMLSDALPAIEQAVEERVRERVLRDGAVDRFGTNAVAAVKTARALHAEPEKFLSDHEAEALADYEAEALEAALIKYLEAEFSQPSTDSQGEGR